MHAVTGGRNGYGAKLANIFSTSFTVETLDVEHGLLYRQQFRNNMRERDAPVVKADSRKKGFTCITFTPDLARFGMTCLDDDIVALMTKRVYDVAGVTNKTLKVFLNDVPIPIAAFKDYVVL
jgi:DNA topoisomerase-2